MAKQQRERITERNRPTRKVVGEDEIAAPAADLRNPIVMIAGATLALTLVLGMWSFFTAEPVPAAPQAPAVEGLPEGFDLEGLDLDAPPVEVIDGSVEGGEDTSESEADDAADEGTSEEGDASADEDADASEGEEDASVQDQDEGAGDDAGADGEAASDEEAPEAPSDEDGASDEDGG